MLGFRSEYKIIPKKYVPYLSFDILANFFRKTEIKRNTDGGTFDLEYWPWMNPAYAYSKRHKIWYQRWSWF